MKSLILLSFLAIATLSACSSGNNGPAKVSKCTSKWKQLPTDRKAVEKTDLTAAGSVNLPAGRYDATSTGLYYSNKALNIKMQFSAKIDPDTNQVKFDIECLSGVNRNLKPMSIVIPFVSNMVVDANGKTILSTRTMTLEIGRVEGLGLLRTRSDEVSSNVQGSLKDTYAGYPEKKSTLFKLNEKAYETRTQLRSESPEKSVDPSLDVRFFVSYAKDRVLPENPESPAPAAPAATDVNPAPEQ